MLFSTSLPAILLALAPSAYAKSVSTTPHDKYSSSVGVLGCKIDTNRVAYWPGSIECDNICVKLTHGSRSVHLLRIDQSGGAHDISYDAWAYLQTGKSATEKPITGGGVDMEYEEVDASECADLIYTKDSKLPLSASNSINYLTSCLSQPNSWVAKNHVLYNICDPICTLGYDETCDLDLDTSNQPSCAHTLGLQSELTSAPVFDIAYESGDVVNAGTGDTVDSSNVKTPDDAEESAPVTSDAPEVAQPSTTSHPGGVFAESASTTVATEEPTVVSEQPIVEPVPESSVAGVVESLTSAVIPPRTTPAPIASATDLTTLVTISSTVSDASSTGSSTASVSPSQSTPSGTPSPTPESAAPSLAHVPFLLVVSSALLCLMLS